MAEHQSGLIGRPDSRGPAALPTRSLLAAGLCWVLAALVYFAAEGLAATAFPDYSYALNYISDLGVPDPGFLGGRPIDSPLHPVITLAFIAQGILFAVGAVLGGLRSGTHLRGIFIAFALIHALGMITIAVIHGGQENIDAGLGSLHLIGAMMAFVGGNLAVLTFGACLLLKPSADPVVEGSRNRFLGVLSLILGAIGLIGILMLQIDVRVLSPTLLPDGIWERMSLYTILVWQLLFGLATLLRGRRQGRARGHAGFWAGDQPSAD